MVVLAVTVAVNAVRDAPKAGLDRGLDTPRLLLVGQLHNAFLLAAITTATVTANTTIVRVVAGPIVACGHGHGAA